MNEDDEEGRKLNYEEEVEQHQWRQEFAESLDE